MSTIAKKRNIFSVLFGTGADLEEEDYSGVVLLPELQNTLTSINVKAENVKKGFNSGAKPSKGGFAKKFDPKTEAVLEQMRRQPSQKPKEDKERCD